MANKIRLKKHLIFTFMCVICLLSLFLIINIYEYNVYTKNFNNKIVVMVNKIKEEYPDISDNEIMQIFNSEGSDTKLFDKYGIDVDTDSIILENNKSYHIFLAINIGFLLLSNFILLIIFFKYNYEKNKELDEIIKYIEEINKKNYSLHIDEISEDELSILKNEIYKTTVMLKENAENSLKDKVELKKSLEDISHQLKTPLTSILVMLDNLIDNPDMDFDTREDFIRDVKREVVNINFLVQAILKLSKFDANTINFSRENRLVKDIINESVKNVSTLCDLRNIQVEINGDEKAQLNCDFMWQVEAITNIVKNCIDHSNTGNKISISYEKNNVYVLIKIQDFGDGISKKDLPHIFERFYKGENSTADSVGIGLALSKTIIEKDNGNICVESERGKGSCFVIKYFEA